MTQEPEWKIQAYVCTQLFRRNILHHGDQNAGKRGPRAAAQAKATGLRAGWPDLVVMQLSQTPLQPPVTTYIEYKTTSGRLSNNQRILHAEMDELGLKVHVINALDGPHAWEQTMVVLGLHE